MWLKRDLLAQTPPRRPRRPASTCVAGPTLRTFWRWSGWGLRLAFLKVPIWWQGVHNENHCTGSWLHEVCKDKRMPTSRWARSTHSMVSESCTVKESSRQCLPFAFDIENVLSIHLMSVDYKSEIFQNIGKQFSQLNITSLSRTFSPPPTRHKFWSRTHWSSSLGSLASKLEPLGKLFNPWATVSSFVT